LCFDEFEEDKKIALILCFQEIEENKKCAKKSKAKSLLSKKEFSRSIMTTKGKG
jgi:hypothetical protein